MCSFRPIDSLLYLRRWLTHNCSGITDSRNQYFIMQDSYPEHISASTIRVWWSGVFGFSQWCHSFTSSKLVSCLGGPNYAETSIQAIALFIFPKAFGCSHILTRNFARTSERMHNIYQTKKSKFLSFDFFKFITYVVIIGVLDIVTIVKISYLRANNVCLLPCSKVIE